jgi:hypothetical protein
MDTNQILTITVFIVVMTIVGTIALAAIGYLAFRLRQRRNPTRPGMDETMTRPYFFERVRFPAAPAVANPATGLPASPAAPAPEPGEPAALDSGAARA